MASYISTGFQASHLGKAIQEVNAMLDAREKEDKNQKERHFPYPEELTSGIREIIRFIVQHNLVDCLVTSAGGVEEDLIKCLAPSYLGDFRMDGKDLRSKGLNRAGNILIPNDNYCKFEDWLTPILDECLKEQNDNGVSWTPSKLCRRMGERINNEESILYWAARNHIPVFCPALTDGSLGDMLYFHSVKHSQGVRLDIVEVIFSLR
ncbi:unnamed protein product [Cylicostephanus goldi]|uniref:Deoxyhypusine synthase n=1 Tax=Cylicostephanus goldi TaxID=71465 RepID=A0A3P7QDT9_CYLGO|nr:unnamed protein product [Cylicostephanus goldi]